MNKNDEKRSNELPKHLQNCYQNKINEAPYREKAVWAATLLYFTILYILFKLIFNNQCTIQNIPCWVIPIIIIIMCFFFLLFILFIHTQYGLYRCTIYLRKILNKYIFEIISKKILPPNTHGKYKRMMNFQKQYRKTLII